MDGDYIWVPTEVQVVLRLVDAIFKFPALWPYINDAPDRGDIMLRSKCMSSSI